MRLEPFAPRRLGGFIAPALTVLLLGACATAPGERQPRTTQRDRTVTGAAVGAAVGAAATAVILGKREADEILAGAAVGAVTGGSVGWYMDRQEERLARIPGTTVERVSEDTLMVHFDSDILFDVDSAVLDGGSRGTLDQVASVIAEYPKTAVVVQGHTDSTGSETHNQQLSERRAQSVHNYLVGRGISTGRMTALGYGESMPVAANDTDYGRQQNRRVDILLKAKAR
ncbi:MAG TPA: OmpA family protein [Thermoanaerobaculia bacterium]|nr:OmpA family protein [Thermoanaerobaculia bacterium]